MGIELFGFCHEFNGTANLTHTFGSQVLEGNLATVAVEIHTVVGGSIAVSRQRVVGAAGVVAGTLTGIFSEEDTAGIHHALGQLFVVLRLDNEVFGGVGVGEGNHLVGGTDEHAAAVFQSLDGYLLTW